MMQELNLNYDTEFFNFNENIKITLEKTEIHILNYERRNKKWYL